MLERYHKTRSNSLAIAGEPMVERKGPLATRLEKANIDVKIDQPLLLLSPSVYNNQTEIDRLLNAVA
jgi:selenocysteine lyase/cysteine desulfurase